VVALQLYRVDEDEDADVDAPFDPEAIHPI